MNRVIEATITSGTNFSSEVSFSRNNERLEMGSLVLSGTYDNTSFSIEAKIDDQWYQVYDAIGSAFSVAVATGKHTLPADTFKDVEVVRVKGAVNETAQRTVKFVLVNILD